MNVSFFYDPSCPFCWITSRWLTQVAEVRNITIDWQPFSLAIKNNELQDGSGDNSGNQSSHLESHRILRVIQAAAATADADPGKLYTDFGKIKHVDGDPYDDMAIDIVLGINSLPPELAAAADDTSYDAAIEKSMDIALAATGKDVGVPIILFTQEDGQRAGFFGPVFQSLPDKETGLRAWDGLSAIATVPQFYELKRTRPKDAPDTGSTKDIVGKSIC